MAFNVGTISATLELDGQQFIGSLKAAGDATDEFGDSAREASSETEGWFRSVSDLKDAFDFFKDAAGLVVDGVLAIVDVLKQAVEASDEFEANVQSLDVALRLRNLGSMKDDLVDLSIELEGATKFSRNTALQVERLLTVFGVNRRDIPGFTEAVLNLSHAMGIDTVAAARLLGRSLSGSVGRLSQYLPEAKGLSDSVLRMGGAFELVNERLGGFAKAAANTSEAIEARFFNAVTAALQSLGDALSPVVDVFFESGRNILNGLAEGIAANQGRIKALFAGLAQTGVRALQFLLDFLIDLPVHVTRVEVFFGKLKDTILGTFNEAKISALGFLATLQQKFAEFAGSIGGKLFGFSKEDAEAARSALAGTEAALAAAQAQGVLLAKNLADSTVEGDKLIAAAQAASDAIRSGADSSSVWAKFVQVVKKNLDGANASLQGMVDGTEKVKDNFEGITGRSTELAARLKQLSEITGITGANYSKVGREARIAALATEKSAKAAKDLSADTSSAADSADRLAGSFSGVAQSAQQAADSMGSVTGSGRFGVFGGGGGGSGDGGVTGVRAPGQGPTRGLGLDSADATQAYINSLQGRTAGLSNIYGSRTNANNFIQQLTAKLRGQIAEETKAFTSGIIDELNRTGILDPTARSAYIAQRFDEARRLGVLPRGANFNSQLSTAYGTG